MRPENDSINCPLELSRCKPKAAAITPMSMRPTPFGFDDLISCLWRTNPAKNMYLKPMTCLLQLRRKRLPTNPFSTRVSKYLQKGHSITTVHSKIQSLTFSLTCCPRLFILKLFFCVYEIYNKYVVCLLLRRIY